MGNLKARGGGLLGFFGGLVRGDDGVHKMDNYKMGLLKERKYLG